MSIQCRIQKCRCDPARLQGIHLVFHQRDERRNHNSQSIAQQRRQLKAKRFPAARRHQRKHIAPGKCIAYDFLLQWPKFVVAKMLL